MIIGGGPAGIELSGEIVTDLKGKRVTLIHSRPELINNAPNLTEQFRKCLYDKMVQHGINVLLSKKLHLFMQIYITCDQMFLLELNIFKGALDNFNIIPTFFFQKY